MKDLKEQIKRVATKNDLDPKLVQAICHIESNMNPWAARFEPKWRYFFKITEFSKQNKITFETEKIQQATSWGLLQIVGSVSREVGYSGPLTKLCDPEIGLQYGCLKLKDLIVKYEKIEEAIASYNAGSPRYKDEEFVNQIYVDKVFGKLRDIT